MVCVGGDDILSVGNDAGCAKATAPDDKDRAKAQAAMEIASRLLLLRSAAERPNKRDNIGPAFACIPAVVLECEMHAKSCTIRRKNCVKLLVETPYIDPRSTG
jgi:hypothetical protein